MLSFVIEMLRIFLIFLENTAENGKFLEINYWSKT